MENQFGPIALLSSGETSITGGRVFDAVAQRLPMPLRIAVLETPAGFELNSPQVAGRVADFMRIRLQNYNPIIDIIPARKRGTPFSPDSAEILGSLAQANLIFMGPGSPTYAVRQLRGSLAWDVLRLRHQQGAALIFASAATVAVGMCAIPVYEIYKVGEDVRVVPGLDLFADFGLTISFVPHWNNTDGGEDVDTSRCFIGLERFQQWCAQLPSGHTTVGLDEHTGLLLDFAAEKCMVNGVSSVTLLRECNPEIFPAGAEFPLTELGNFHWPEKTEVQPGAKELLAHTPAAGGPEQVPEEVVGLVEERRQARNRKDWARADEYRLKIAALGWTVRDGTDGQEIVRGGE